MSIRCTWGSAGLGFGLGLVLAACSTGPRTVTASTCADKIDRLAIEASRGLIHSKTDGLRADEVDSRIKAKKHEFRACVEGLADLNDGLSHTVQLGALIERDGTIGNACVEYSQFANGKVDECIEEVLKGIRFPAPRGGASIAIHYPFHFKKE
ncbi:MAG: AgmX/PglI C-terminal domain-containing protein [Bdellovibrionales bacterium]|nr:AgmX/PglI C-terminal domain-containing protein [Bdellovibrionales bacterium]